MKHTFYYLTLALIILSCSNNKKETKIKLKNTKTSTTSVSEIIKNNYAVTWRWTTEDEELVIANSEIVSKELTALWKKNIIENAYYNSDSKVDKLSYFPNISFSIKAESSETAEIILNNLTIVKKGIAVFTIYPTGNLWLNRKTEVISQNGMTKSFVTVWKTKSKPTDEIAKNQSDKMLALWKSGKVENAYFDIAGTQKSNNVADFVFYANANTKEEAIALCESLPIFKENIATYKLFEVDVFWMGKYKKD